ncbi:hypothetical protein CSW10_03105 [Mesomycoplasma dispar]|uniref:Lipoprotein n=2 Tax=Mesomycoplasma dispar TaxID=86660 RepID=A0ABN5E089_9BACT|nr:hypothetical protein CSW10_03105 [Mesomycoplasma dispar]
MNKIKLFIKTLLLNGSFSIPLILVSCITGNDGKVVDDHKIDEKNKIDTDKILDEFKGLIQIDYQKKGIKSLSFSPAEAYYRTVRKNYEHRYDKLFDKKLLNEKGFLEISNFQDFKTKVFNSFVLKTKNIPNFPQISETAFKKEFENKFLDGQKIENVLTKKNILISEEYIENYGNLVYFHYFLVSENDRKFSIQILTQSDISRIDNSVLPDVIFSHYSTIWTVFQVSKSKKVSYSTLDQNVLLERGLDNKSRSSNSLKIQKEFLKIFEHLRNEYKDIKQEFLNNKIKDNFEKFLFSVQEKEKIHRNSSSILTSLNDKIDRFNNPFFKDSHVIIKTKEDFQNLIIKRWKELNKDESKLTEAELIKNFEKDFLENKQLDNVLQSQNMLIFETWIDKYLQIHQKNEKNSYQLISWLIPFKKTENEIYFSAIDPKNDFLNRCFCKKWELPFANNAFNFSNVGFQVVLVPKNLKIIFEKNVDKIELNENLVKNYT